ISLNMSTVYHTIYAGMKRTPSENNGIPKAWAQKKPPIQGRFFGAGLVRFLGFGQVPDIERQNHSHNRR
ncbi:hypothetical protein, partial [Halomonas sp. 3A7M]|uniref:hypothetical protein n=1 Tax=Halomonas sp. 3A7M TaxID=2742616 RepID=UPI001D0198BC